MNTLTNALPADLLQHLFAETEASVLGDSPALADLSETELKHLMGDKIEYHELYGRLKDLALPVSRETGSLFYVLARSSPAHGIVEFGTSFGLPTLHFATALRGSGGDRLTGNESEPSKTRRAWRNLAVGGLFDLVELRGGDALQTFVKDLPDSIDLVPLNGTEALCLEVPALLESRLRPGALMIIGNAEHSPEYLTHVYSPANGYLSTPFARDVELSMHLGWGLATDGVSRVCQSLAHAARTA